MRASRQPGLRCAAAPSMPALRLTLRATPRPSGGRALPRQFLDPVLVMEHCGREIGWLVAAASMKRAVVGRFARALGAIPVARPQDLAHKVRTAAVADRPFATRC